MMSQPIDSRLIKSLASELGFSDCGIAKAACLSEDEFPLGEWLDCGFNADMQYMERNAEMRRDPRLVVDGARSIVSLVVSYKPDGIMQGVPRIAQYAYGEDYHERLKRMMYQLVARITTLYPDFECRPFVDTAPVSDRHWAVRAGLGWIGKNTLFVHPVYGSLCYLCELVTTATFDSYDTPMDVSDACCDCSRCVDACPNNAIALRNGIFMVDARRCSSYNTIENRRQELPDELDLRGYAFGCDICQMTCPFNENVPVAYRLDDIRRSELESLADADEAAFRHFSKHSALSRIKYPQWLRNVNKAKSGLYKKRAPDGEH